MHGVLGSWSKWDEPEPLVTGPGFAVTSPAQAPLPDTSISRIVVDSPFAIPIIDYSPPFPKETTHDTPSR